MDALADTYVDVAFLGTNGVSAERGLTTPDPAEAAVKRAMIAASRRSVVLADRSKRVDAEGLPDHGCGSRDLLRCGREGRGGEPAGV